MNFDTHKRLKEVLKKVIEVSDKEADEIIEKRRDELEKIRLLSVINFLDYAFSIKENAYTFRLLGSIFALEGLVAAKQKDKERRVKKLLRDNLCFEDKSSLLAGFTFSKKYEFKKDRVYPLRHIMFEDFDKDTNFKNKNFITEVEYCSGSSTPICRCLEWLKENQNKIDDYLDILIAYFYEMRHAIVHESFPVLGLPDYSEKHTVGSFSASLLDAYPIGRDKKYFRSYEAEIDPDIFFGIIKKCIKNYLIS